MSRIRNRGARNVREPRRPRRSKRFWALLGGASVIVSLLSGVIPLKEAAQKATQESIRVDFSDLKRDGCAHGIAILKDEALNPNKGLP